MAKIEYFFERELPFKLIDETFKKAFNKNLDENYWEWRFLNNPNDDKVYISYILEDNTLAAYYAVTPCTIFINGRKEKIALSNMTMTHPEHQGKGYFKMLAKNLFEKLKNDGYIGVFGFANQNSHYGFKKYLGWKDLSIINTFQVSKSNFRGFLLKDIEAFDTETSRISNKDIDIISDFDFCDSRFFLSRSGQNVKWRLVDIPTNNYFIKKIIFNEKTIGFILFKYFNNEIDIMEYFYKSDFKKSKFEIFGKGISCFFNNEIEKINYWSNFHSEEHLLLEKIGFKELGFNTYFGVIPFIEDNSILDFKNWHYRFFDSDIY